MILTQHFGYHEFACHDGTDYPVEWIDERLRPLCAMLEEIRAACDNHRMIILSGYRTPAHNELLRDADGSGTGVAKNSQHLVGRAADIAVEGLAPSDVWRAVDALYKAGRIPMLGGRGIYPGWVHVDIREKVDGHLAQWMGTGVTSWPA